MKRASSLFVYRSKNKSSHSSLVIYAQFHHVVEQHSEHIWIKTRESKFATAGPGPSCDKDKRQKLHSNHSNRHCPLTGHFQWEGVTFLHLAANSWHWTTAEPTSGFFLLVGCIIRMPPEDRPGWDCERIMNDSVSYRCLTSHETMWKWLREDIGALSCSERLLCIPLHNAFWKEKAICNQVKTR